MQHGSKAEAQSFRAEIDIEQCSIDALLGDENARTFDRGGDLPRAARVSLSHSTNRTAELHWPPGCHADVDVEAPVFNFDVAPLSTSGRRVFAAKEKELFALMRRVRVWPISPDEDENAVVAVTKNRSRHGSLKK